MAHYFFHLRDHVDSLIDPEGMDLPDIPSAMTAALEAARDTLSHEMKLGLIDLRFRIDVEDENGSVVYSLPFKDAFQVLE